MTKVYSGILSITIDSFIELFDGAPLDKKIMEKSGCLKYKTLQLGNFPSQKYSRDNDGTNIIDKFQGLLWGSQVLSKSQCLIMEMDVILRKF